MKWLHEPLNGKLRYPSFVGKKKKDIVEGSWWFWDLLVQRIKEKGALPPTHLCRQICGAIFVQKDEARSRWSYAVCIILPLTNVQATMGTA
jgi:hypothetical protein